MKVLLIGFTLLSLIGISACEQSQLSEKGDIDPTQLNEIQQQLNLLTKEVIGLRKQVSDLGSSPVQEKKAQLAELPLGNDITVFGRGDAEYAIVEYMDYQCPYCLRHAKKVLPALKRKYIDSGLIKYIVRDFPLEFHAEAVNAAKMARCSANQGKFPEAHGLLVSKARELNSTIYASLASELELDSESFIQCFDNPELTQTVNNSFTDATKLGVTGTPRFFIGKVEGDRLVNVISMSGARSIDAFEKKLAAVFSGS
jgi:protein-disulfide isomerase